MTEDENGFRTYESDNDLIEDSRNRPPLEIDTGSLIQALERANAKLARVETFAAQINRGRGRWAANGIRAAIDGTLNHESDV